LQHKPRADIKEKNHKKYAPQKKRREFKEILDPTVVAIQKQNKRKKHSAKKNLKVTLGRKTKQKKKFAHINARGSGESKRAGIQLVKRD